MQQQVEREGEREELDHLPASLDHQDKESNIVAHHSHIHQLCGEGEGEREREGGREGGKEGGGKRRGIFNIMIR